MFLVVTIQNQIAKSYGSGLTFLFFLFYFLVLTNTFGEIFYIVDKKQQKNPKKNKQTNKLTMKIESVHEVLYSFGEKLLSLTLV